MVFERLVQRSVVSRGARVRTALRSAYPGALLPAAAAVFPRLENECAAALGRALGARLGAASCGLGPLESWRGAAAGSFADLSAQVCRRPLSASRRAACAEPAQLRVSAARR